VNGWMMGSAGVIFYITMSDSVIVVSLCVPVTYLAI